MPISNVVRTRIDEQIKEEAIPFVPLVPSATTIAAKKEARRGGLTSFNTVQDQMADLNEDN